jgi:hypothetical protein
MFNGRISLQPRESVAPGGQGEGDYVQAFQYRQEIVGSEAAAQVSGLVEQTPLNKAFFSPANFQIVQNKLRKEVYDRSNGEFLIDPQSADQLMIVMRAMYLQYGKNQPTNIAGQIAELNQMVADWCVPKILAEASMYKTYLNDIQHLPIPLQQPVFMSMKGSKTQQFDRFF